MPEDAPLVYVTDASVFIDAWNVGLFPIFFELGEMVTTNLVLFEWRRDPDCGDALSRVVERGDLGVATLDKPALDAVVAAFLKNRSLSVPDRSILHVAVARPGVLLTSDGRLRNLAKARQLRVHGLIYCLAQLIGDQLCTRPEACVHLERWRITNTYAPKKLIEEYLAKWGS